MRTYFILGTFIFTLSSQAQKSSFDVTDIADNYHTTSLTETIEAISAVVSPKKPIKREKALAAITVEVKNIRGGNLLLVPQRPAHRCGSFDR